MAEYIERDIMLAKFIEGDGDDDFTIGYNFAVNEYRDKLKAMPAAVVQPVKHGKWLQHDKPDDYFWCCSSCKKWIIYAEHDLHKHHFCGNCGARMDGALNE